MLVKSRSQRLVDEGKCLDGLLEELPNEPQHQIIYQCRPEIITKNKIKPKAGIRLLSPHGKNIRNE
jgi:hypothetical protein